MEDDMGKNNVTQHISPSDKGSGQPAYDPVAGNYEPSRRRGGGVKRHCVRCWWLYLLILIIVVLVTTLPIVYVAFPHIAQSAVNDSTINVTSMAILNPTPDSFDLGLATVLGSKSKYHPSLDAFNSSLYLEGSDTPFANVEIPAVHADDGAVSNVNQTVNIGNQTGFGDYAKTVFKNETVTLVVKGKTGLHEGKLPATTVTYDKQITMKGLNSLKGFAVTSFQILLTTQPDGSNMLGTIYIPNPTVMTIEMGTITLLLSIAGTPIGVATLNNLTLVPGNNTIQMRSKTDQGAVIKYLLQPQYRSGILPVDIVGNSSVFNGQQLPYFQNALEQNKMAVDLNVGQALIQAGLGSLLGLGGSGTSSSITAPAGPRSEGTSSSASTAESGSGTTASSTAAPSGSGSARTPTTSPTAAPAASGSGTTTTS